MHDREGDSKAVRALASVLTMAALAAILPQSASAADNGFYIGAALAEPSTDYDFSFAPAPAGPVDDDVAYKFIGGIRPLDRLAFELDYVDFGSSEAGFSLQCFTAPCPDHAIVDVSAVSLSVLGIMTLPALDLFARAGIASWELDRSVPHFGDAPGDDGTDLTYGVGIQFRLQSLGIRIEYERFDFDSDSSELLSLGITYTFL